MASGFPGGGGGIGGGGGSDFFSGRSIMNNPNNNSQPQNNPYRTQLSQIFLDSSSQIAHHQQQRQLHHSPASSYIGKRSLSEYQSSYYQPQQSQSGLNPALNAFLARSVKPRICQNQNPTTTSPISTLSPIEFSANNFSPELPAVAQHQQQQRYGFPLLQQLRPQPINISQNSSSNNNNPQFQALQGIPFANSVQSTQPSQMSQSNNRGIVAPAAAPPLESEKKMMNRLQELEKQLLDDDDDDNEDEDGCGGGDAVSVITNTNSEWSETIQNLISPSSSSSPTTTGNNNNNNNPISPSSSSSTTSSTTTSAATPAICTRPVLMEAAAAIYEGKSDSAAEILSRVGSSGGKGGNSEQRLMDYLFSALKSRVNPAENPPPVAELYGKEHVASTQLLFERSPCFKLGFMAANLAILESTLEVEEDQEQGKKNKKKSNGFHVVDFDIGQGGQYVNLLYALAERLNGSTAVVVKITAVPDGSGGEEERQRLNSVGEELRQLAERLGITLRFSVAASCKQLGDLSRESLGCEAEEPLAVNFAFKLYRMADESVSTENPRDELLRRVRAMEPRVVTVVEQEMNGNTAPFLARVNEACGYYGALLESIEATVPSEAERGRVEEGVGRKLANAVACEGRDRVERCEVFGKWRARMGMAGFKPKPLSQTVTESMRARLQSANWANPGFTVKEDNGGACFGWMGKSLTVASAWR